MAGHAIQFDGRASSGLGGLSYHWSFGDGTSATGATPVKAYAAVGVYHVTLTVRDYSGATSVAATTATVSCGAVLTSVGCYTNLGGVLVCGTAVSGISGCVLTGAGWVCPGTVVPGPVVSGVVVSGYGYPGSSGPLPDCTKPAYAYTSACMLLNKS